MRRKNPLILLIAIMVLSMMGLGAQCGFGGESPTLILEVYDGPDYSEDDEMCYYRVEAISTGTPAPEIDFAGDDNVEEIGTGRAEIGVEAGDSYTLTATATNSAGTASATIVLGSDCNVDMEAAEADADEDVDPGADSDADSDSDSDSDSDADSDSDSDSDSDADGVGVEPTISLAISQDATYSPGDDVCYYRIEATVTGDPSPNVSWSEDESNGSFGNKKAQVNLNRGETYTLTATATNSAGSATATMTLSWGCGEDDSGDGDGDGDTVETVSNDCRIDRNLCGYIEKDTSVLTRVVWVGDNGSDRQLKGYISFDISGFAGPDVYDARLVLGNITGAVDPTFADNLVVKADRYGEELDLGDFAAGGVHLKTVSTAGLTQVVITGSGLISAVQEAVDRYGDYFQIKIGLDRVSDEDGVADFFNIDLGASSLVVETNNA